MWALSQQTFRACGLRNGVHASSGVTCCALSVVPQAVWISSCPLTAILAKATPKPAPKVVWPAVRRLAEARFLAGP